MLKNRFPDVPIIALTATATEDVIADVKKILRIERAVDFKSPFNRPNLHYSVLPKHDKNEQVLSDMAALIHAQYANATGIVYCFSKKECEAVADYLCRAKIKSAPYHADMSPQERQRVHDFWYTGRIKVVVATVAFGAACDLHWFSYVDHILTCLCVCGSLRRHGYVQSTSRRCLQVAFTPRVASFTPSPLSSCLKTMTLSLQASTNPTCVL